MTEQELSAFCANLIKTLMEKELGCIAFIIDRDGGAALTLIPEWSVIQYDKEKEKIVLDKKDDDTETSWIDRAMRTLYFLEAVKKNCEENEKLVEVLSSSLERMVAKLLTDSNSEPEQRVLH